MLVFAFFDKVDQVRYNAYEEQNEQQDVVLVCNRLYLNFLLTSGNLNVMFMEQASVVPEEQVHYNYDDCKEGRKY